MFRKCLIIYPAGPDYIKFRILAPPPPVYYYYSSYYSSVMPPPTTPTRTYRGGLYELLNPSIRGNVLGYHIYRNSYRGKAENGTNELTIDYSC